jgi:hypothetical protein
MRRFPRSARAWCRCSGGAPAHLNPWFIDAVLAQLMLRLFHSNASQPRSICSVGLVRNVHGDIERSASTFMSLAVTRTNTPESGHHRGSLLVSQLVDHHVDAMQALRGRCGETDQGEIRSRLWATCFKMIFGMYITTC